MTLTYSIQTTLLPAALMLSVTTSMSAAQHVITVDDDGQDMPHADFNNLEQAVESACAYLASSSSHARSATIRVSPGVYGLVETLEMPVGGLLVIRGMEGAEETTINASSVDIAMDIQGGAVKLEGLKLRTRTSTDPQDERIGIRCDDVHLALEDCIFSNLESPDDPGDASGTGMFASNSTEHMKEVVLSLIHI